MFILLPCFLRLHLNLFINLLKWKLIKGLNINLMMTLIFHTIYCLVIFSKIQIIQCLLVILYIWIAIIY